MTLNEYIIENPLTSDDLDQLFSLACNPIFNAEICRLYRLALSDRRFTDNEGHSFHIADGRWKVTNPWRYADIFKTVTMRVLQGTQTWKNAYNSDRVAASLKTWQAGAQEAIRSVD